MYSEKYNENFKKAFADFMEETMVSPFVDVPDYQFPKKFEQKMQSLFKHPNSYIVAQNKIIPLRKILICAVIAATMTIISLTAAANWKEIRAFFMEVFADHSRVTYVAEGGFPETIETIYMPEYVPNGFALLESEKDIISTYFYYQNETKYFSFEQNIKSVVTNINSELSEVEIIDVNGYDGYCLEFENEITFIWTTDEYTFRIIGDIGKDEAVKIAMSGTAPLNCRS